MYSKICFVIVSLLLFSNLSLSQDNKKVESKVITPVPIKADAVVNVNDKTPNPNGPIMKSLDDTFKFGTINQGDVVEHTFKIKNEGKEELKLTSVKPSCGCTSPDWPKEAIQPGETADIHVKFNSTGKMGKQKKSITIHTNESSNNVHVLYLEGEVLKPAPKTDAETK